MLSFPRFRSKIHFPRCASEMHKVNAQSEYQITITVRRYISMYLRYCFEPISLRIYKHLFSIFNHACIQNTNLAFIYRKILLIYNVYYLFKKSVYLEYVVDKFSKIISNCFKVIYRCIKI